MKTRNIFGTILLMLLTACASGAPAATAAPPPAATAASAATSPATAVPATATNAPAAATSGAVHVSFQDVSFDIPTGVASGADAEVVPASDQSAPWDTAPQHVKFTLKDYPIPAGSLLKAATIEVFPAPDYVNMNNGAALNVPRLRDVLLNSPVVTVDNAPAVPSFNAQLSLVARSVYTKFQTGGGLDSVVYYSQFPGPIVREGQFFQYLGLSAMGNFYVVAVFPIMSPLQSTTDNPSADGVTYPDPGTAAAADIRTYYDAMSAMLTNADANAYQPSLTSLEEMMQSITLAHP